MKHFCNYEHLGGCSDTLIVRADYWLGPARKRFGAYAYWCEAHAPQVSPLACRGPLRLLTRPQPRYPKAEVSTS